ncbi:YwmB family TATA-box binding protein [Sporolactobacillus shoreicorticis]|uniref:YwmB family TATA-box binding protein n=1 Tax=Sporolactobacillus shoreicorticis TaxID=1923877 RepID=A0ABW5S545_9BACL|nr:YwmB family TATA-box binding protein [Sporolactobacillus shoreicorticis]MCO7127689.1 YwmB family TATA-box binding protein [Sporolactobacillus shoreicorticis]
MKRILYLICFFFLAFQLFTAFNQNQVSAEHGTHQFDELNQIGLFAHALEKNQAHVSSWSVYAREIQASEVTHKYFDSKAARLEKKFKDYTWKQLSPNEGAIGWEGTKKIQPENVRMSISYMAYPHGKHFQAVILYRVNGECFKQIQWSQIVKYMRTEMKQIFNGQEHIYTCVKAYHSAKMKLALIDEGMRYLKLFSATPVERLQEKTFVSISAYTKTWNNAIYTANKKMNIQAALRNDGDRTIIVLGSPIITVEY